MPKDAIEETILEYVESFKSLDLERILSFVGDSGMFVSSQFAMALNAEQIRSVMAGQIEQMKAEGYDHSEAHGMKTELLGNGLGIADCEMARYDKDGKELTRFRTIYVLRRDGERWAIVVSVVGDRPDADWSA